MNRSFNRDRCPRFPQTTVQCCNKTGMLTVYCQVMYYILVSSMEHAVFTLPLWHLCRGQDHEKLAHLVTFGIRLGATDCYWPSRSVIPFFLWMDAFTLTVPNYCWFCSQVRHDILYIYTDTVWRQTHSKLHFEFETSQNKKLYPFWSWFM